MIMIISVYFFYWKNVFFCPSCFFSAFWFFSRSHSFVRIFILLLLLFLVAFDFSRSKTFFSNEWRMMMNNFSYLCFATWNFILWFKHVVFSMHALLCTICFNFHQFGSSPILHTHFIQCYDSTAIAWILFFFICFFFSFLDFYFNFCHSRFTKYIRHLIKSAYYNVWELEIKISIRNWNKSDVAKPSNLYKWPIRDGFVVDFFCSNKKIWIILVRDSIS